MPDFSELTAIRTGPVDHVPTDGRGRDENFGMQFDGYFKAEEDGVPRFSLSSDDGSIVTMGDATVIDNNGPHPMGERSWLHNQDLGLRLYIKPYGS